MNHFQGPAYRVETQRLRLRCFAPHDTSSLSRAIAESIEHLRPWLTWTAHEPLSFDERLTWIRSQRGHFDLGGDYSFAVFGKDEKSLLGTGLLRMASSVDERELGYWIHADHLRRGLAAELAAALTRIAFDVEQVDALELRTFTHNAASAALATKLGFAGPVVDPLSFPMPDGDKVDLHVFTMSRVEYASAPARNASLEAYDILDRRIL